MFAIIGQLEPRNEELARAVEWKRAHGATFTEMGGGIMTRFISHATAWRMCSFCCLIGGVLLVSCGDYSEPIASTATPQSITGQYQSVRVVKSVSCQPAALPAATTADANSYVRVPAVNETDTITFSMSVAGSGLTEAPVTDFAGKAHSQALIGSLAGLSDSYSVAGSGDMMLEASRAGGHTFFVTSQTTSGGIFAILRELPPGVGDDVLITYATTTAYTFREGGVTGAVFTTCTVADSAHANRQSS
jgi:hypothetical protein